jgi:hypothetical protein
MDPFKARGVVARIVPVVAYEAQGDTNMDDGRGPMRHIGWFLNEDLAREAAKGQGAMGTPGYVRNLTCDAVIYTDPKTNKEVIRRIGEVLAIEFDDTDEVRARALAKLSPKERQVLGLK